MPTRYNRDLYLKRRARLKSEGKIPYKKEETKVCLFCEGEFSTKRSIKKFCSSECREQKGLALGYGLSCQEYRTLFKRAAGRCEICRREVIRPCVDHDHKTGKVRGMICKKCNSALGMFQDDPEVIERAASYLRNR